MAEEKSRSERRYGGKEDKKPEPKKEPEKAPEGEGEGEKKDGAGEHDARTAMMKRHEKEARDLHGQHRDAMRDMHNRQMAEMSASNAQGAPAPGQEPAVAEGLAGAGPGAGLPGG